MISTITRYYQIQLYENDTDDEGYELTLKEKRVSEDTIHFEIKWESGNYTEGYVGKIDRGILFLDGESCLGTVIKYPINFDKICTELNDIEVYDMEDCEAVATSIELICEECFDIPIISNELPF